MPNISKEDLEKLSQVQLPEEINNMIQATRSQFFGEVGGCFENSLKGLELVIKGLVVSIAQLKAENDKLKTPNRATRRKSVKKKK